MKTASFLALIFLCASTGVRADWLQDYEADSREARQTDLDAVPGKAQMERTPEQIKEDKDRRDQIKAEQKREYDAQNWLIEAYDARVKAAEQNQEAADDAASTASLKPHDDIAASMLRNDPSLETGLPPGSPSSMMKPFLAGAAPMRYPPTAAPAPFLPAPTAMLTFSPSPTVPVENQPRDDAGALDVPGMTAAESDPASKPAADISPADLAPDTMTPGQNPNDKIPQPLELELPVAKTSEQLERLQRQAMGLPQANPNAQNSNAPKPGVVAVAPDPLPPKGDEDERVSTPESMHNGREVDPFDILR